jgi:hypothetical protein
VRFSGFVVLETEFSGEDASDDLSEIKITTS